MTTTGDQRERFTDFLDGPQASYMGRVDFAKGSIDASEVSETAFMEQLEYIARECLEFAPDVRQLFGGCMDGRGNIKTDAGNPVAPRPKLIGGPSLFAWYTATIGNFSVIDGVDDPLEQFYIVNKKLVEAGFRLGMHRECGAARGVQSVVENYMGDFDGITGLIGAKALAVAQYKDGVLLDAIGSGLERTQHNLERATSHADPKKLFIEENMLEIVKSLDGDDAVIHLATDHDHATHGHEEIGLAFMRVNNAVVNKDKANRETQNQVFYQNVPYAKRIVEAIARTQAELSKGIIIGDQLPLAGVTTLGNRQYVGEITGQLELEAA